ncbi:MAG: phosphatase PAP2 family protein [Anaerolineae bacterium]|nr:phosphatase PAP2 family protein [Anaerolineae bacterium]
MDEGNHAASDAILKPSTRGEHVAYWISQLGSPPLVALLALLLTAVTLTLPGIWMWAGVYVLLALIIPLSYLVWLVRRGKVADLDLHLREQRYGPFVVTLAGAALAWGVLTLGGAPQVLRLLAAATGVQTLVVFLITLRWKISVHTSTAAGMTVLVWSVVGKAAAPLVITIPLIAWSRVKLRRHTFWQTVAGIVLGGLIFLIAVWLAKGG